MAECRRFICSSCRFTIEAWDDGNPYLIENGKKRYVYHPSSDRDRAVGNDDPAICLDCGRKTKLDSRAPRTACTKCRSSRLQPMADLAGCECPACHTGTFVQDAFTGMIS